jgi:hypothetical protein
LASNPPAAPYTFTENDYLEYGIYFSEGRGAPASKLLTLRYGDIDTYYAEKLPWVKTPLSGTPQLLNHDVSNGNRSPNMRITPE